MLSPQTIAHATNAQGQNAGSVFLFADDVYPGSPAGRYGYLRQADGSVKYFAVNELQSAPGRTRARGISESGLIAGFYSDPAASETKSYVTMLSKGTGFEELTLTVEQVVYQKPCNAELPPAPGPEYELFTDMTASQVRNDGVVVGTCFETYYNGTTGDYVEYVSGFIANPVK